MKTSFTYLLLLMTLMSFGQTAIKKSSVSTGGGSAAAGNTSITYAIGETAVQETQQGNTAISEGFVGPDILQSLGISDFGELQGISVYPNPVKDVFSVQLPENQTYEFYLFNLNGKQIFVKTSDRQTEQFNIARLRAAVYILIVVDKIHKRKKIVKIEKR